MMFRPEMLERVLAGDKTVTRRPVKQAPSIYEVGREYAIQPGRGQKAVGRLRIVDLVAAPLRGIFGIGEAQREGFETAPDFLDYWAELYGDCDLEQLVWRIEFRLVEPTPPGEA